MTYRELLESYKRNELEQKKRSEVEADIEKQEAISDYLYDRPESPGFILSSDNEELMQDEVLEERQERDFTKMVNRLMRRAFIKMGTVVGIVILIIVLFIQLALPKIVSAFYYNPGKIVAQDTNQISLDMVVYTELAIPNCFRYSISAEEKGYGNYDICIYQDVSMNGMFTDLNGTIEKGKLTLYGNNVLKRPAGNVFAWFEIKGNHNASLKKLIADNQSNLSAAGSASDAAQSLKDLADNTKYEAYVTLDQMMNYEDFQHFLSGWDDLYRVWCAIYTDNGEGSSEDRICTDNLGFFCTLSSSTSLSWDKMKYPNLLLWDSSSNGNTEELDNNMSQEAFMKTHFTSMLRYISRQDQFLSMMKESVDTYSAAADYVEKNGLTIYGFAAVADKETLLKLNEAEEVYEIYTQPIS